MKHTHTTYQQEPTFVLIQLENPQQRHQIPRVETREVQVFHFCLKTTLIHPKQGDLDIVPQGFQEVTNLELRIVVSLSPITHLGSPTGFSNPVVGFVLMLSTFRILIFTYKFTFTSIILFKGISLLSQEG